MKKNFLYYAICWICLVVLFNLIYFVAFHNGTLEISYGFVMVAFVVHFLFVWFVLLKSNEKKRMLNIPLIFISCIEVLVMTIAGILCMLIPNLADVVSTFICGIILAVSIILLVIAKVVGENTVDANNKLNESTSYYKEIIDNSQKLLGVAMDKEIRVIAEKVVEAIRYSDPMSSETTHSLEMIIDDNVNQLYELIKNEGTVDFVEAKADELLNIIADRNNRCKTQKRLVK